MKSDDAPQLVRARDDSRIPALDGLRGIAILLVMLNHFTHDAGQSHVTVPVLRQIAESAWCGVDLFFVLSGFLITGILWQARDADGYFRNFYMRRVLRIFPLYYGALALVFFIAPLVHPFTPAMREMAANQGWLWLFSGNILMGLRGDWVFDVGWVNIGHFWSLAVEEHFYLVWPALVFFLKKRDLMAVCAFAVVVAFTSRVWLRLVEGDPVGAFVLTNARMDALAIGSFIALVVRSEGGGAALVRPAFIAGTLSALGLAGVIVICGGHLDWAHWADQTVGFTLLAAFFGALLVLVVYLPADSLWGRFWASPILRFFGKYSFGLYVFHHLLLPFTPRLFPIDRIGVTAHVLLAMALSLLIALASWHGYEKHFLRLKRFFPYRRRTEPDPFHATA